MEQMTPQEWAHEQLRRAPSFAISAAFVVGTLILSTFIEYSVGNPRSDDLVPVEAEIAQEEPPVLDEIKEKIDPQKPDLKPVDPREAPPVDDKDAVPIDAPLDNVTVDTTITEDTNSNATEPTDPFPMDLAKKMATIGTEPGTGGFRGALGNRTPAGKRRAAAIFGMPPETNKTILEALRWLKKAQNPETGGWDAGKWEGTASTSTGVSGLALLAFLGYGCTDKQPAEFAPTVRKAVDYILRCQKKGKDTGGVNRDGWFGSCMYTQGICTMALAEYYGMTGHLDPKRAAADGMEYIGRMQAPHGAFGYGGPGNDSSVTGFQMQATKACLSVGVEVSKEIRSRFETYLSISMAKNGATPYQVSPGVNVQADGRPSTTSATLTGRLFLGHKPNAPDCMRQAEYLIDGDQHVTLAKQAGNYYAIYYHCLSMFQMGGKYWKSWNAAFNEPLRKQQVADGPDKGSWPGGGTGGRVYSTAMACLALEVYFRYLPSYKGFGP